jgi:transposase
VLAWRGLETKESALAGLPIAPDLQKRILEARTGGMSVRKTAAKFGVNAATVQRISGPFELKRRRVRR